VARGPSCRTPPAAAALHSLFLGFVFAMIFGHAPVIFPAVLGGRMIFRSGFYFSSDAAPRVVGDAVAGDLDSAWFAGGWARARAWGGILNAAAILLFLVNTISSLRFEGGGGARKGAAR